MHAGGAAHAETAPDLEKAKSWVTDPLPREAWGPWLARVAALLFFCAFPAFAFGVIFTATGFGVEVINGLVDNGGRSTVLLAAGMSTLLLLYVTDFSYWKGAFWFIKNFLLLCAILLVIAGVVLSAKDYPQTPLMAYLLVAPAYFAAIRFMFFRKLNHAYFLSALAPALFLTGVVGITWWAVDINRRDEVWPGTNCEVRCNFYRSLHCPGVLPAGVFTNSSLEDGCACLPIGVVRDTNCELAAFLVWTSLFIASTAVIVFSFVVHFLAQSFMAGTDAHSLNKNVQVFGALVSLGLLGLWVASQIGGADMALSNVVMAFSGAFIFAVFCVIGALIGWDLLDKELSEIPMIASMKNSFASDWLKAWGFFLLPIYFVFLAISMINHFFRVHLTPCAYKTSEEDKKRWLTLIAHKQWNGIKAWPWTSVLTKVMLIGFFYFSFSVGVGKLTYIFLSYVNEQLNGVALATVTIIFVCIGLTMFLLPPVPGAPVYLVGGVMLTGSAWREWGGTETAFWQGAFYTSGVCFLIKLLAITTQQKGIGERMSGSVGVRKAVGVNSITIRAIKHILTQPGLSIGKVAILTGGPDWPTSVLTGILKLRLSAMLFGSIPVLFLITPTVLAGALMLRQNAGGIYNSLGSMFLALCALVQSLGLFAAMYFIEEVSAKRHNELAAEKDDEEVKAEEEKAAQRKADFDAVTQWDVLPTFQKGNLWLGALLTAAYCFMFGLFGSSCFESYNITDTIAGQLGGNVLNVVKPNALTSGGSGFGWHGLGLFGICVVQYIIFSQWAGCRVRGTTTVMETHRERVPSES